MSQLLTLALKVPAEATIDFTLYGFTYRVTGAIAGERVFGFDLSPTYAAEFDRVVRAAVQREDASMTATAWRSGMSSADGVLTIHSEQSGEASTRVDWTLGSEAAVELQRWIKR